MAVDERSRPGEGNGSPEGGSGVKTTKSKQTACARIRETYRINRELLNAALDTKEPQQSHAVAARRNRIEALRWIVERLREVYGL